MKIFIDRFRKQMLDSGYGGHQGSKALLIRETIAIGMAGIAYRHDRSLDPQTVAEYVDEFRRKYDLRIIQGRNKDYETWGAARDMLNAASEVVGEMNPLGLVPAGAMLREIWKLSGDRRIGTYMDSMAAGLASQKQYELVKAFSSLVDGVVKSTVEGTAGDENVRYREAVDRILIYTESACKDPICHLPLGRSYVSRGFVEEPA